MQKQETSRVGKRGVVVIPVRLRRRFGLEEGSLVVVEEVPQGVLIRPAMALAVEVYSPSRRAELLLNNATSVDDYEAALVEVRKLGLDPADIPHERPGTPADAGDVGDAGDAGDVGTEKQRPLGRAGNEPR